MEKKVKKVQKNKDKTEGKNVEVVSAQLKKQISKKENRKEKPQRGVVCLKNLPHGFFEPQLKKYFKQFGNVTRLRLSRSLKAGNSRGYAFVEFEIPEVAEIAAETMNNYLMFKKIVKAKYIPPEEQKYNYFKSSVKLVRTKVGKDKYVSAYTRRVAKQMARHNNWTEEVYRKRIQTSIQKLEKLKAKYAQLGIDFDSITVKPDSETLSKIEAQERKVSAKDEADSTTREKPKSSKKKDVLKTGVEALLGSSLNEEDSSDDDFCSTGSLKSHKDSSNKSTKSQNIKLRKADGKVSHPKGEDVSLRAILEDTLNDDDSSDEEFVPGDGSGSDDDTGDSDMELGALEESEDGTGDSQESEELEFEDDSDSNEGMQFKKPKDFKKVVKNGQTNKYQKSKKENNSYDEITLLKKLDETNNLIETLETQKPKLKQKNKKHLPGRIHKKKKKSVKEAPNSLKVKLQVSAAKEILKNQTPAKAAKTYFKKQNK